MAASLDYFNKVKLKGNDASRLQERYQEATKGLDKDVAFEALEGGRVFDTGDRRRYDALMAERGKAKEKAQVFQSLREGTDTNTEQATALAETPAYGEAKPFDIRDRDVRARSNYDPRYDKRE